MTKEELDKKLLSLKISYYLIVAMDTVLYIVILYLGNQILNIIFPSVGIFNVIFSVLSFIGYLFLVSMTHFDYKNKCNDILI